MQSPTQHPSETIQIEPQPSSARLQDLGIAQWPIWTKEISEFPWTYEESETCYFLEGKVIVTPVNGAPVQMGKGDLVTFPAGMSCTWQVLQPVRKHYQFG
jgi:uncharacterized cupin superfamily protein